jgi:nucleoside-diphosphate-sugar epimerase
VRDVADAHVKALTAKPNQRYILLERMILLSEIAEILNDNFKPHGYKVLTRKVPKFAVYLGSYFSN